jgi:hypothetical protein
MKKVKAEDILSSIADILRHINDVQKDVKELSERSSVQFFNLMESSGKEIDEETAKAFQYQDIISQQLDAVCEAIDSIEQNISSYISSISEENNTLSHSIEQLSETLNNSLEKAKNKKVAFMGNALSDVSGESYDSEVYFEIDSLIQKK